MNYGTIKKELDAVAATLECATENQTISSIEKDIVLERLRRIYEGVLNFDVNKCADIEAIEEPIQEEAPLEMPPATIEELLEKPFRAPIDRSIIESLYGDDTLCKKEEQPDAAVESDEIPAKVLHETLNAENVASVHSAQAAGQLRNTIGLNDRLMLLNDLFENDPALYEKALDNLDVFDNIDDAYIYLYENFTIDDSKDGAKLLMSLLEAKFK